MKRLIILIMMALVTTALGSAITLVPDNGWDLDANTTTGLFEGQPDYDLSVSSSAITFRNGAYYFSPDAPTCGTPVDPSDPSIGFAEYTTFCIYTSSLESRLVTVENYSVGNYIGMTHIEPPILPVYNWTVEAEDMNFTTVDENEVLTGTGTLADVFDGDSDTYMSYFWNSTASASSGFSFWFDVGIQTDILSDESAYIEISYFVNESCGVGGGHAGTLSVKGFDDDFNDDINGGNLGITFPTSGDEDYPAVVPPTLGGDGTYPTVYTDYAQGTGNLRTFVGLSNSNGPTSDDTCLEMGVYDITVHYQSYTEPPLPPTTPPTIDSSVPVSDTSITLGDTLPMSITVSELDNDTLSYEWLVDSISQTNNLSTFTFDSDTYGVGSYDLEAQVFDPDGNDTTSWVVNVTAVPTGYFPNYTSEDLSPIVLDGLGTTGVGFGKFAIIIGIFLAIGLAVVMFRKP